MWSLQTSAIINVTSITPAFSSATLVVNETRVVNLATEHFYGNSSLLYMEPPKEQGFLGEVCEDGSS